MRFLIKNNLNEELTKKDVDKQIKAYIDSKTFKEKIEKIIKDRLKDNVELENKMVDITKNVLSQLYKTLWVKKTFWTNQISNKKN